MAYRTAFLLLACAAVGSGSLHARQAGTEPPGWVQERPVPKPPHAVGPMPHWYEVGGGAWQVPPEILQQIAARLKARLDANEYYSKPGADYAIQFRGEFAGARRIVRLFGTCTSEYIPPSMLSDDFIVIRDGGECNFDAEYDAAEQAISTFKYYGYA